MWLPGQLQDVAGSCFGTAPEIVIRNSGGRTSRFDGFGCDRHSPQTAQWLIRAFHSQIKMRFCFCLLLFLSPKDQVWWSTDDYPVHQSPVDLSVEILETKVNGSKRRLINTWTAKICWAPTAIVRPRLGRPKRCCRHWASQLERCHLCQAIRTDWFV